MAIYREISVWDRSTEGLYRYRVLENMNTGEYCVLMRDYFGTGSSVPKVPLPNFDKYFIELLVEMAPENRNGKYHTMQEAIEGFEKYSSNEVSGQTEEGGS